MKFLNRDYEPTCNKLIPLTEQGRKYEAVNPQEKPVLKIHVDGDLITTGERCDFALDVTDENKLYLVELKGCDKAHAYEQLLATMKFLNDNGLKRAFYPRIIVSKDSAPKIKSTAQKKLEKLVSCHKCEECIVKTRFFSETI